MILIKYYIHNFCSILFIFLLISISLSYIECRFINSSAHAFNFSHNASVLIIIRIKHYFELSWSLLSIYRNFLLFLRNCHECYLVIKSIDLLRTYCKQRSEYKSSDAYKLTCETARRYFCYLDFAHMYIHTYNVYTYVYRCSPYCRETMYLHGYMYIYMYTSVEHVWRAYAIWQGRGRDCSRTTSPVNSWSQK